MKKTKPYIADLALLLATFFWGSSFIPVKSLVATIPPYELLTIRFGIVGIILLPIIIPRFKGKDVPGIFKCAFILGLLLFSGFAFQTVGMKYTTATNSAFVTGLNVVFVPIFLSLLGHHKPRLQLWVCVLIAIIGLAIFSLQANWRINYGDFLVFFCALVFSFHVIYTSRFTNLHDPIILTGIQFMLVFIIGGIVSLVIEQGQWVQPDFHGWMNILYLAIFATGISILLQANFQRYTETTRAALIYVMEPVFAAILGYLLLREHLTGRQWIGAVLILSAMILSEIKIDKEEKRSIIKK